MDVVPTISVIGVPLFNGSIDDAATEVISQILKDGYKHSHCVSATGAHGIVASKHDPEFRNVLNSFYMNLADGMPGVWISKMKGAAKIKRCYGPDFFKKLIVETGDKKINHFFCGGKKGVADELKNASWIQFGNKNIVGTYSPPFREMTDEELSDLAKTIENAHTNILWIGISTPKQEKFAYRISKVCKVDFIVTVGAAFDFHIGNVKQAPKLVQRIGLEWFFRLCVEPKRLWKRYIEIVPLFIYYNILEFLSIKENKKLV